MPFILLLLRPVLDWFYTLPIKPVQSFAAWLERRGVALRDDYRSCDKNGNVVCIYLAEEFAGFAVHIVKA